jgi:hypothetical protein
MAALQLAERGFFVKELNVGWKEWAEEKLTAHVGAVAAGEIKCGCSRM